MADLEHWRAGTEGVRSSNQDQNDQRNGWNERSAERVCAFSQSPKPELKSLLAEMVEGEIIPRLMLAHQASVAQREAASRFEFSRAEIQNRAVGEFTKLVLTHEVDFLIEHVDALISRGISIQSIYLDLLAPTARKLGVLWETDECTFTDVTIGLGRLQQVLRDYCRSGDYIETKPGEARSVLLVTLPKEQHSFGVLMTEELFRRAGWNTRCEVSPSASEVSSLIQTQWFDVFGVGLSNDDDFEAARALIVRVRTLSMNRDIKILAGGWAVAEFPALAASLGADLLTSNNSDTVALASSIVLQVPSRG